MEFRVIGLDGKVVVITGGARGMGAAYVRGFLAEGAKVVAADLSWDGVEAFRAEVEAAGGLPLLMDVTGNSAIDDAYAAVIERFGTVDVLVNNAGMRQRDLYPPHGRVTTLETLSLRNRGTHWRTRDGKIRKTQGDLLLFCHKT